MMSVWIILAAIVGLIIGGGLVFGWFMWSLWDIFNH